jgi:hypothetical protein
MIVAAMRVADLVIMLPLSRCPSSVRVALASAYANLATRLDNTWNPANKPCHLGHSGG